MAAFKLLREQALAELNGIARLWRHEQTGAEMLSVCNSDENKCFGVSFRTPAHDSTGVAHILEHSVLCGSKKYPVKEPFVELLKGSLQTFLNAVTFPDKTCYPVASANLQDFYNLVDVYLDAVFHPLISEDIFRQEGWHIETGSTDGPFGYKGVVYNEMKGVYSSPDALLGEQSQQSLFPDNCYGLDSGGNPDVIPKLEYAAFRDFHKRHYHPSNARFFFWGDDPEDKRLEIIAQVLQNYKRIAVDSQIHEQPRLAAPRRIEELYAAGEDENKAHITMNWLLCPSGDIEELMRLEMLDHILLGLPGSPLRKALIDSGLGEDIAGSGLETDLRQAWFSVGLRSVVPDKTREVELLIMETLADLAANGISRQSVEAAVNSLEFELREDNTGRFPRGLSAMFRSLTTWLHDGDPLAPLAWEKPLADIKERLAGGEKIFEAALARWFLDNQHRSTVILLPSATLDEETEQRRASELAALCKGLSGAQRAELARSTEALRNAQDRPDSPQALATIPELRLEDLPLKNQILPGEHILAESIPIYAHDLPTSGILYADMLFPLDSVPDDLLDLLPLFARALTEMGTAQRDFVEFGLSLATHTGGLEADTLIMPRHGSDRPVSGLRLGGKATRDKISQFFDLLTEAAVQVRLDDPDRFLQMLLEERARMEQSLIPAGHGLAASRLRARYSAAGNLTEKTGGLSYLRSLRTLSAQITDCWPDILSRLEKLRSLILVRAGLQINLTADSALLKLAMPLAARFADSMPIGAQVAARKSDRATIAQAEALIVPAQVNYVGKGANLFDLGYKWHGSAHVITRYMRMAWLWEQVRVRGGAYGVFCALDRASGVFTQVSYRDPNIAQTLAAYDASADWLKKLKPGKRELTQAIVGAIGDLDTYLLPDAKGMAAFTRHLAGDSEEARQIMRDQILSTSAADFRAFADIMREAARTGAISVLGGQTAEAEARAKQWMIEKVL